MEPEPHPLHRRVGRRRCRARLWLFNCKTAETTLLGGDSLDVVEPKSLRWNQEGSELLFVRAFRGRHQIASISVPGDDLLVHVDGERQLGSFGLTRNHMAFPIEHPTLPSELWATPIARPRRCRSRP